MTYIVDRIEGRLAVCEKEDGSFVDIPLDELPFGVKAGDVLSVKDNVINLDKVATKERKEKMNEIMKDMWE
ncbi:DUF3006 domain-containing protein [Bacillus sp. M6-12]|uniref:DUF3006 domain-containing protein n=1 Tax=Bacillus sp. M6-12 TaxID=2054166 RepID=UPI000C763277|nr:DUF3006 domain-containing protein [Bacillus sp. M6-12]PLS19051.1 DUF3006 domain-containing protein [Bacillus sp. M6-12]